MWYVAMGVWIVVTIIDCCSDEWTKLNVVVKDLCIISNIIAIIYLKSNMPQCSMD